jgi:pectinesterase inhibitor-like protein
MGKCNTGECSVTTDCNAPRSPTCRRAFHSKAVAALAQCQKLYDAVGFAFAEATDAINSRDYAAGKAKVARAVSLTRQCDAAMARAGAVPSPLTQYSSYSVKIAAVCTAITSLIK